MGSGGPWEGRGCSRAEGRGGLGSDNLDLP